MVGCILIQIVLPELFTGELESTYLYWVDALFRFLYFVLWYNLVVCTVLAPKIFLRTRAFAFNVWNCYMARKRKLLFCAKTVNVTGFYREYQNIIQRLVDQRKKISWFQCLIKSCSFCPRGSKIAHLPSGKTRLVQTNTSLAEQQIYSKLY